MWEWNLEVEQLGGCPWVVSQSSYNGRSSLNAAMARGTDRQFQTQTMMEVAEIVEAPNKIHAYRQSFGMLGTVRARRVKEWIHWRKVAVK
jgi:hypothetical protein